MRRVLEGEPGRLSFPFDATHGYMQERQELRPARASPKRERDKRSADLLRSIGVDLTRR